MSMTENDEFLDGKEVWGGIELRELQERVREKGIKEGDRWKDWREMVERGIALPWANCNTILWLFLVLLFPF